MPEPARWLDRDQTAHYLSVRVDELPRLLRRGKLPTPSLHLGPRTPRWDRHALDAVFAGGVASPSVDQAVDRIVHELIRKSRPQAAR